MQYAGFHWKTPRQAWHSTRSVLYHLAHPEAPLFFLRCTMCQREIPTTTYIACSICKEKGPRFCGVRPHYFIERFPYTPSLGVDS